MASAAPYGAAATGGVTVLEYANYLRSRADECISLAVDTPWGDATAALIDLAMDYRALADGFAQRGTPAAESDREEADPLLEDLEEGECAPPSGILMLVRRIAGYSS